MYLRKELALDFGLDSLATFQDNPRTLDLHSEILQNGTKALLRQICVPMTCFNNPRISHSTISHAIAPNKDVSLQNEPYTGTMTTK